MSDRRRVALVTGAGGIGSACAARLAARGLSVAVADLDAEAAGRTAGAIDGHAITVDATDLDQNRAMIDAVLGRYGRLDVLVPCVGANSHVPVGAPLNLAHYRRSASVNIDSVVFAIDAAMPALARRGGSIVVVASLASLAPGASNPVYTLAKSAVLGYVRAMAAPLGAYHVSVNALCPSFVDTPMVGGTTRAALVRQGFPLLAPADVATAMEVVLDDSGTGQAWALLAGRPPYRYEYPDVPGSRCPDGTPAPELTFAMPTHYYAVTTPVAEGRCRPD